MLKMKTIAIDVARLFLAKLIKFFCFKLSENKEDLINSIYING